MRQRSLLGQRRPQIRNLAKESVGIAVGFLLAALHAAGLAALTHTPAPMRFPREALGRPANERAFASSPSATRPPARPSRL